jgi:hypothetical protein
MRFAHKSPKCSKTSYFRSQLEYAYALWLDNNPNIIEWEYEKMIMWYTDGFTGERKKYLCDFTIKHIDGLTENVEVKTKIKQTYEDKYLYAQNIISNWRFITNHELLELNALDRIRDPGH